MPDIGKVVNSLRSFRKVHRSLGLILAGFLFISAVTGILLGWKKDADWIQPPTQKGTTQSLQDWLPLPELQSKAITALQNARPDLQEYQLDRMDIRPNKGMAKMLFTEQNMEVQIDGVNGQILSVARRHSDWIEALHDGSIVSDFFKWCSMNFLGIGLVVLLLSGTWLWLGPRNIRTRRRRRN